MAFNIPDDQQEVVDRVRTDVQNSVPESNPFFPGSLLGASIIAFAGRVFDFYLQQNVLIQELFVDTATDSFLERWGSYKDITRNAATISSGPATVTGTVSSNIPSATQFQDAEGNQFVTTTSETIANVSISVSTLTRSGSTVTATTATDHEFGSTQTVTIAGAVETEYNGAQSITVISANSFTYEITTTPTTPATGTILADADMVTVNVESVAFGDDQNLDSGTNLTLSSPISGVDDTAIVQFAEVAGGTDQESDEDLRERIIDKYQNPIAHFSENEIIAKAKEVAGVTRVFVTQANEAFGNTIAVTSITRDGSVATVVTTAPHNLEDAMSVTISAAVETDYNITARILVVDSTTFIYVVANAPTTPATGTILASPFVALGQVVAFFTRDNDANIIPSASEVTTTKNKILEIKPANTGDVDVIVNAPTANTVNFTFTALIPNTSTMQAEITANLIAFFRESTTVGEDIVSFAYESVIFNTVDSETGSIVQDFTLSAPSGDITIASDEIGVLGSITYP